MQELLQPISACGNELNLGRKSRRFGKPKGGSGKKGGWVEGAHPAVLPSAAGDVGVAAGADEGAERDAQVLQRAAGHRR